MADKPKKLRFLCTVSENGQIFIPVKMREVMGVGSKDIVRFEFEPGGVISFCKEAEASAAEQGEKAKEEKDSKKREKDLT